MPKNATPSPPKTTPERRKRDDRRTGEDRRDFPRPEGRRRGGGRRATDPKEA
ncbi:MAG: hypothetical protein IPK71_34820 [Myxococcales bacterium]|nr:hypothetical protein [Myxococcales bacterium]MBL9111370.1 hypothetical protein [Myxococcales bacterium]